MPKRAFKSIHMKSVQMLLMIGYIQLESLFLTAKTD